MCGVSVQNIWVKDDVVVAEEMMTWVIAMMSVGLHTSRTSTLHIPDFVVSGDKFLQWDDVSYSLFVM